MDLYQFVASIVGSLAWPSMILTALILFRRKLMELLPLLEAEVKGVKFRFASAAKEVVKLTLEQVPSAGDNPTPEEISKFEEIKKLSPRAAVLELAYELEEAVRGFAAGMGIDQNTRTTTLRGLTRLLRSHELIDEKTSALLDDLNAIGNVAKHGRELDLTEADAGRFQQYAQVAINQFHIVTEAAKAMDRPAPLPPEGIAG